MCGYVNGKCPAANMQPCMRIQTEVAEGLGGWETLGFIDQPQATHKKDERQFE